MRRGQTVWAGAVGIVAALCLGAAPVAAAEPADERLAAVDTWAFAIGSGTLKGDLERRYAGYDLLVVDGQEVGRRQVRELREAGRIVLGYLSVGTIETWRPWYRRLKRFRLEAWKEWKGEFFAEVSRRGFRRQITRRIAPRLLAKGLDGLFLDNVDMIEGHRRQTRGMRKLVRGLGRLSHRAGGLLFAQNGFRVLGPFLPHLDGWNREDVSTGYDFDRNRYRSKRPRRVRKAQRELRAVARAGLLVTATDYTRRGRGRRAARAVTAACAAGAIPYVSDIGLQRVPAAPQGCDRGPPAALLDWR